MKTIVIVYFAIQAFGIETGNSYGEPIEMKITDVTAACLETSMLIAPHSRGDYEKIKNDPERLKAFKDNRYRRLERYYPQNRIKGIEWKVVGEISCEEINLESN